MTFKADSIVLLVACVMATSGVGCSASRWMTRRDYAEMADPFLAAPQEKSLIAGSEGAANNTDGVVRLGQPPAASYAGQSTTGVASLSRTAGEGSLNGPKPLQPAAVNHRNSTAKASYPARATMPEQRTAALTGSNGPSLSDFMSTATDNRAAAEQMSNGGPPVSSAAAQTSASEFAAFDAFVQQNQKSNAPSRTNVQTSFEQIEAAAAGGNLPAATDAAAAPRSQLAAAFGDPPPTATMQQNARKSAHAPPAWDPGASPSASRTPTNAGGTAENPFAVAAEQAANQPSASTLHTATESLPTQGMGFETPATVTTDMNRAELNSGTASTNPFAGFDQSPQNSDNGKSSSLDNSFHIDSGWKPSQLVRP